MTAILFSCSVSSAGLTVTIDAACSVFMNWVFIGSGDGLARSHYLNQ